MSDSFIQDPPPARKIDLASHAMVLIVVCIVVLFGNTVATDNTLPQLEQEVRRLATSFGL